LQIDAIVTDLDDTLLNENAELSDLTLSVLARAKARGIRHIPASGRAARSMYPYTSKLGLTVPYIACNGSQLVTPDHQVFDTVCLDAGRAREIIRYCKARGFYVQSYRDDDFYIDAECDASVSYQRSSLMNAVAVGDLEAFTTFPVPKLLCVHDPAEVERTYPDIRAAFPDVEFTISKPYFLEAQPAGVSKGAALKRLAGMIGLTPERTLVFGDSLNDVSMMAYAVHSVAMGNARDDVKAAARYICQTNAEDGVARFIQEHVLA
jgi:hypothetical protein